jgi:hypothetical protein
MPPAAARPGRSGARRGRRYCTRAIGVPSAGGGRGARHSGARLWDQKGRAARPRAARPPGGGRARRRSCRPCRSGRPGHPGSHCVSSATPKRGRSLPWPAGRRLRHYATAFTSSQSGVERASQAEEAPGGRRREGAGQGWHERDEIVGCGPMRSKRVRPRVGIRRRDWHGADHEPDPGEGEASIRLEPRRRLWRGRAARSRAASGDAQKRRERARGPAERSIRSAPGPIDAI